ncbi:MAG: NADH-quinone oxidoreductase subunit J [Candidatus Thorarchaeota archaeon]
MQGDIDAMVNFFEPFEFLLIAGAIILLAFLALEHKDIVYAAFFFGLMASVVAGIFLLLEAPFVAGMQIAVYTGGISALIIFGVLLLPKAQDQTLEPFSSPLKKKLGLIISGTVTFLSATLALIFPWYEGNEAHVELSQSLEELAIWLWRDHGIYIQIVALILLTSLVGAMAIMRMEKAERLKPITAEFGIEVLDLEDSLDESPIEPAETESTEEVPSE